MDNTFSLFGMTVGREKSPDTLSIQKDLDAFMSGCDDYQKTMINAPANISMKCVAGAGSGKTRSIVGRAIRLVIEERVQPYKIVLITFTNKAAKEMKERYVKFFEKYENDPNKVPHISTIHSFSLYHLRRNFGFVRTILSEYQSVKLFRDTCKTVCRECKIPYPELSTVNSWYNAIQSMVASLKVLYAVFPIFNEKGNLVEVREFKDYCNEPFWKTARLLPISQMRVLLNNQNNTSKAYDEILQTVPQNLLFGNWVEIIKRFLHEKYKNNLLDFSDMIFQQVCVLLQYPELQKKVFARIDHILCDEAQDLSPDQFALCLLSDKDSFSKLQEIAHGKDAGKH
ncbi:MAG: UvrD-helicase domain-containing protein [Candidatus Pacearchaeota archaeon]